MSTTIPRSDVRVGKSPPTPSTPSRPRTIHAPVVVRPATVEKAVKAHASIDGRLVAALARRKELEEAHVSAKAADIRADADRAVQGKPALAPDERAEPKAAGDLAESTRECIVLSTAAAETDSRLQVAIHAERDAWLSKAMVERERCVQVYIEALLAVREASAELTRAAGAVDWLEAVTERDVPMGVSSGRLTARLGRMDYAISEVLSALTAAAQPKGTSGRA